MPHQTDTSRFSRPATPGWTPRIVTRTEDSARFAPPRAAAMTAPDQSVSVTVSDVLDYFEKCPRCGYPAQATATVRRYENGRVETAIHPSCGLPCGWHGTVEVTTQQRMRAESDPRPPTAVSG